MTPKEKAQELVDKFLPEVRGADRYNYNIESMNVFIAKQCALIAVDEVINNNQKLLSPEQYHSELNFWNEVKTELNN